MGVFDAELYLRLRGEEQLIAGAAKGGRRTLMKAPARSSQ